MKENCAINLKTLESESESESIISVSYDNVMNLILTKTIYFERKFVSTLLHRLYLKLLVMFFFTLNVMEKAMVW